MRSLRCAGWVARELSHVQSRAAPRGDRGGRAAPRVPRVSRAGPVLARIRDQLGDVKLWISVADGSGAPLVPGAVDYETALASATPAAPAGLTPDDLYVLYPGGTTGMPKGVLWRQEDIFRAALYPRPTATPEEVVAHALQGGRLIGSADAQRAAGERRRAPAREGGIRSLPAPPFMHGAAHWVAFNMWFVGGTIVVQSHPDRLHPND